MLLDRAGHAGQIEDFLVIEHEGGALGLRCGHIAGHRPGFARIDHLDVFRPARLFDDRLEIGLAEERFVDLIFIGVHRALDDIFAKAPGGVDQHGLVEARFGVDREHHAGAGNVGADHLLDADRQRHLRVVETLQPAIGDRPVSEERGIAAPAGFEQRHFAPHVQKGLLLAGKARLGQVLGGRRRAHRDRQVLGAGPFGQFLIGGQDVGADIVRPFALEDRAPDRLACLLQRQPAIIEPFDLILDEGVQIIVRQIGAERVGRGGKASGHRNALAAKLLHHLAERGILAADLGDVSACQFLEKDDIVRCAGHWKFLRWKTLMAVGNLARRRLGFLDWCQGPAICRAYVKRG